ncbi:MFS transporter [Ehrlichia canis]|uniref:General substrate transporter n=1 Tax=Ehrlichia canis (strain Jake) TaxID=269484 RepID=A0ACA6AVI0_EHRCJ|nr:MFS transporter [Ehrlichia canis]AAZ68312.1 General substrate transporter [Ehrlichia canis str. Jake]AUO54926.1 MFS transporter [Ehrlichia canis]UKC53198.1 MFS transporter [Ehrlichia canis]UKC54135.1 MFS transporter [Ehrlichia canis]UKC55071.1 MFS transporter [Ehrlichia canis]
MSTRSSVKPILSILICAFVECYDFLIYGNFSRMFSKMFFAHITEDFAMVLSLMSFGMAFFVRPFGSLLFGYIGDKYGRKTALFSSATLLIISVGGIAFLPLFETIGVLSPILLIVFRVLQGLSFAGEIGAVVLMVENAKNTRNIIYAMYSHFIVGIFGGAVGCYIFKLCNNLIPEYQFYSWGWRIPFIVGLLMSFSLPFLRNSIEESREYLYYNNKNKISKVPIVDIILNYKYPFIMVCIFVPFCNALFYTFFVFLEVQSKVNVLIYSLLILTIVLSGYLISLICRVYKTTTVVFSANIFFIVIISPLIWFFGESIFTYFLTALSLGMASTPLSAILMLLFPANVRQTGYSVAFSIGIGCFGMLTPMIFLWLSQLGLSTVFCMDLYALFSLYGFYCLKKDKNVIKYESTFK